MPRSQPIVRNNKDEVRVISERVMNDNIKYADVPLRTVVFVEIGSMSDSQKQVLLQQCAEIYKNYNGGVHYVIPVRNGKLPVDILFEKEFLGLVNQICEVQEGQIVLKDGAKDAKIVRDFI